MENGESINKLVHVCLPSGLSISIRIFLCVYLNGVWLLIADLLNYIWQFSCDSRNVGINLINKELELLILHILIFIISELTTSMKYTAQTTPTCYSFRSPEMRFNSRQDLGKRWRSSFTTQRKVLWRDTLVHHLGRVDSTTSPP